MIAGGVAGGVLDLEENHHILAMIRMGTMPQESILSRLDPVPGRLGNWDIRVERFEHPGHLLVLVEVPSGSTKLRPLGVARSNDPSRDDFRPRRPKAVVAHDTPQR